MNLFTKEEILRISEKMKKNPNFLKMIEKDTENVRKKLYIQKTGRATWLHYYSCPKCSVRLEFDYFDSEHYTCPICKGVCTGEPYSGAWWDIVLCRNYEAAYQLAIAYHATKNADYLKTVKDILLGYADNFKNYEVHGGIPYNNPGRFAAQTLSDSSPVYNLSVAYDLISEELTKDERALIENELLRPSARHLIENLTPQIHNHEVVIASAACAAGVVLGDDELLEAAVNAKYGLKYQAKNAYLSDGLWFEGASGYHLYSLMGFIRAETALRNTKYSLFADEECRAQLYRALLYPAIFCDKDAITLPFNDSHVGRLGGYCSIYEYAYSYFGTPELAWILRVCRGDGKNPAFSTLLYGVDELSECKMPDGFVKNYFCSTKAGSGLAIIKEGKHLFCYKGTPYGGEHDHYDRLALSFAPYYKRICFDLGTSDYGAPLHYGYFKNTASHNTVVIDGANMPPCDTVVNEYTVRDDGTVYLDAATLPPEKYEMLDSFTIKQWDDEAYKGVTMRRVVDYSDDYFVDVFSLNSDNKLSKDYVWHTDAPLVSGQGSEHLERLRDAGPQSHIVNCYKQKGNGVIKSEYQTDGITLDIYSLTDGVEVYHAEGPNNPSNTNISYLILRSYENSPVFVNVFEAHKGDGVINSVEAHVTDGMAMVKITEKNGKVKEISIKI